MVRRGCTRGSAGKDQAHPAQHRDDPVGRSTATLTDVIQTDAAISSGSSGGALVDRSGTVVGITTEALVGDPSVSVEDIAFAIPADRVVAVLRGMGLEVPTTG